MHHDAETFLVLELQSKTMVGQPTWSLPSPPIAQIFHTFKTCTSMNSTQKCCKIVPRGGTGYWVECACPMIFPWSTLCSKRLISMIPKMRRMAMPQCSPMEIKAMLTIRYFLIDNCVLFTNVLVHTHSENFPLILLLAQSDDHVSWSLPQRKSVQRNQPKKVQHYRQNHVALSLSLYVTRAPSNVFPRWGRNPWQMSESNGWNTLAFACLGQRPCMA